jgi:hypothetical protein
MSHMLYLFYMIPSWLPTKIVVSEFTLNINCLEQVSWIWSVNSTLDLPDTLIRCLIPFLYMHLNTFLDTLDSWVCIIKDVKITRKQPWHKALSKELNWRKLSERALVREIQKGFEKMLNCIDTTVAAPYNPRGWSSKNSRVDLKIAR